MASLQLVHIMFSQFECNRHRKYKNMWLMIIYQRGAGSLYPEQPLIVSYITVVVHAGLSLHGHWQLCLL